MRFIYDWSLKPLIVLTLLPTLALGAYMQWGNPDLLCVIGLAWDCGAITTGPVTVPILLSLGIGTMKTTRERDASLKSVLYKFDGNDKVDREEVVVLLKTLGWTVNEHQTMSLLDDLWKVKGRHISLPLLKEHTLAAGGIVPDPPTALEGFGIVTLASILPVFFVELLAICLSLAYSVEDVRAMALVEVSTSEMDLHPVVDILAAMRSILPLNAILFILVVFVLKRDLPFLSIHGEEAPPEDTRAGHARVPFKRSQSMAEFSDAILTGNLGILAIGVLLGLIGLMCFYMGLAWGFTAMGGQVGRLLPASYLHDPRERDSPFYSLGGAR
jgi:hypothetical protein